VDLLRSLARRLRRWDVLVAGVGVLAPLAGLLALGVVRLVEEGGLLVFLLATVALNAMVWGALLLARRIGRAGGGEREGRRAPDAERRHVPADPDWGPGDAAAFRAAQELIAQRIDEPVDMETFQALAREVVETVAAAAPGGKSALDFTLPEALLLVEQVAGRFRADLRDVVPFSDRITLAHGAWIWRHRGRLRHAQTAYSAVRHGVRIAANPPAGLVGVLDSALGSRSQGYLAAEGLAGLQSILLEEIASAAVDLYSGRLRFSDAELLEIQIAATGRDRARIAAPDAPLRVVLAGQVSAGKSSLVSALAAADLAETDTAPTTARGTVYEVEIADMPCHLLDTPGLGGDARSRDALVAELLEADVILWVVRADRPARTPDRQALDAWTSRLAEEPMRRPAPLVPVVTAVDRLSEGWPYREHALPEEARARIAEICAHVEQELGLPAPVPVSLVAPEWNVGRVREAIAGAVPEALACQRNRARLAGRVGAVSGALAEAGRSGRGLLRAGRRYGRTLLRRRGLSE